MVRVTLVAALAASAVLSAQRLTPPTPGTKISTDAKCAADLGLGAKTRRRLCDVVVTQTGAESVVMVVPAHTGPSVLMFDLHNRFVVPTGTSDPAQAFSRQTALVSVMAAGGDVIGRAAVTREFRTIEDLFDQIGGGGRSGGVKAVAPGPPEAVRMTIPATVGAISIVGLRLEQLTATAEETFNAPGRPVAIISNFRIEYTPR